MRRMRDMSFGYYVAVAVPVLVAAFGIHYVVRHQPSAPPKKEVAEATKPSQHGKSAGRKGRSVASVDRADDDAGHQEAVAGAKGAGRETHPDDADSDPRHSPSLVFEGAANDAAASGAECASFEFRGEGLSRTQVTKGEWTRVMDQFHGAKHGLLGLLEKHKGEIPASTAQAMAHQVRTLKIQRPPAADEPDLSWRGIGVYTLNSDGEPIVKLGGGFVKMATKHPARARFEIARLVAQAWSPCELQRVISANDATWSPLLKCLGVNEAQSCAQGTYSESGWAVSTALAKTVASPGCEIPAFKPKDAAQCVARIPFAKVDRAVASDHGSSHEQEQGHGGHHE